jgi:hypothetical protein
MPVKCATDGEKGKFEKKAVDSKKKRDKLITNGLFLMSIQWKCPRIK